MNASSTRVALILCAAGSSTRLPGTLHKVFLPLGNLPILLHSLSLFRWIPGIVQRIIMLHPDDVEMASTRWREEFRELQVTNILPGGPSRQDTVAIALRVLEREIDLVAIHDAARPFTPRSTIQEAIQAAASSGAALVAAPVTSTLKRAAQGRAIATVDRQDLWAAQTPQVFRRELIENAYAKAAADGFRATDDAQLVERLSIPVTLVPGTAENIKVTSPDDYRLALAIFEYRKNMPTDQ